MDSVSIGARCAATMSEHRPASQSLPIPFSLRSTGSVCSRKPGFTWAQDS